MSDDTRTRLCLINYCGLTHECRHSISECVCPYCGSADLMTVWAEQLPGFEDVTPKPVTREYPR